MRQWKFSLADGPKLAKQGGRRVEKQVQCAMKAAPARSLMRRPCQRWSCTICCNHYFQAWQHCTVVNLPKMTSLVSTASMISSPCKPCKGHSVACNSVIGFWGHSLAFVFCLSNKYRKDGTGHPATLLHFATASTSLFSPGAICSRLTRLGPIEKVYHLQ